jgi:hypothetical protein
MRPFNQPPKEDRYQFVLLAYLLNGGIAAFGPFPNVSAADQWWDANAAKEDYCSPNLGYKDYEVVLMEAPDEGP